VRDTAHAFTASGSPPLGDLPGTPMKHLLPWRRPPQDCTRVCFHGTGLHAATARGQLPRSLGTWVAASLGPPSFQRLGAFAKRRSPHGDGVTVLRLLRPIRHWPRSSELQPGAPRASCPLSFASLRKLPVCSVEDASSMREVACCWLPHPRSAAPQAVSRGGQVAREGLCTVTPCSGPSSGLAPTMSGVTGWQLRQGLPGPRFPVGLDTLQVMPHVIPSPSPTSWGLGSPAWRLSGACCSRQRVVYSASLQGLSGSL
jgi:hypothetical protein